MDGMLSQDEINALLSGMDLSGDTPPEVPEEILSSTASQGPMPSNTGFFSGAEASTGGDETLTDVERDAIGEVANISMGSSATTLYSLVNRKVNITTPIVELATWDSLLTEYEKPCVFTQIKYTVGLDGSNIMVLKERDVKIITDLMMGGDGTNIDGEITDLHLSAISEAMIQMMGSEATSLSTMLNSVIDISPPISSLLDLTTVKAAEEIAPFLGGTFVKISFRMQIDTLVDSTIMQLYPIDFAKKLVETFIDTQMGGSGAAASAPEPEPTPAPAPAPSPMGGMGGMPGGDMSGMNGMGMGGMPGMDMNGMQGMNMNGMGMGGMPGMDMNGMGMNGMGMNGMGMQGMNMNGMGMQGMNMNGMGMNG
ncbi:MAG: flagellar motor switch phosphatase FliY, partial [Lachnospiraceae bacterium]|nr:flagellar motor switch phosphatase FliY [Lachnospiraceae bacterium]